jgi:hypothetical protein
LHLSGGARAGAGLISTRSAADVYVSAYSSAPTSMPTTSDFVNIQVSLSISANDESDVTSANVFPAVAAAVSSITVEDLYNFEEEWTSGRRVRRHLLSGTSAVTFSVKKSLATSGYSSAGAFQSAVESELSSAVSSGSLTSNIMSNCGCTLSVSSSSTSLIGAYPTLMPTPAPTSAPKKNKSNGGDDDDTTGVVVGSVFGVIGFVMLVVAGGYFMHAYHRRKFAADFPREPQDGEDAALKQPNPFYRSSSLEMFEKTQSSRPKSTENVVRDSASIAV